MCASKLRRTKISGIQLNRLRVKMKKKKNLETLSLNLAREKKVSKTLEEREKKKIGKVKRRVHFAEVNYEKKKSIEKTKLRKKRSDARIQNALSS